MANATTLRRPTVSGFPRFATPKPSPREKSQGNPLTLAAIREAREGKTTGFVDTTSIESFIKTCSE